MYITLKMKIQDQDFDLDVNLANRAGRIYRQQFGRDILKDMSEIYKKLHKSPFDGLDMSKINVNAETEQEIAEQILASVDIPKLLNERMNQELLNFEETERAGQIIWSFVKNRNNEIPNYEDWIDEFDFILPVDKILIALYEAWGKSAQPTIELKN